MGVEEIVVMLSLPNLSFLDLSVYFSPFSKDIRMSESYRTPVVSDRRLV
uniref:Uncharacterized protein n=1 Tax=Desertifilum tharense IPPAS B-1220 TaxID=1781255 RepID=A0ACD5GQ77_9CYAN